MSNKTVQDLAINQMSSDIAIITEDVSQLNLDLLEIHEELNELKELVRNWNGKRTN